MRIRTARDLGALIRDRRTNLDWSQQNLADRCGASKRWVVAVESGKAGAEIGLVLRALAALGLELTARAGPSPRRHRARCAPRRRRHGRTMNSTDRLDVFLRAEHVGSLEWNRNTQRGSFAYDGSYRAGPDPTPLSLSMPLTVAHHRGSAVAAYFWGLLPDSDAVLQRWGRQFQVSLSNPMGLLANVGSDLPSAWLRLACWVCGSREPES